MSYVVTICKDLGIAIVRVTAQFYVSHKGRNIQSGYPKINFIVFW